MTQTRPCNGRARPILTPLLGWALVLSALTTGCMSERVPPDIMSDEEIQKITRGTVDLRLGVLPPTLEKQDLGDDDDVAAIQYKPAALRELLVKEIGAAGPFSQVIPMGEDQKNDALRPGFDPGLLPADLYVRIRLKEYQVEYDGHNFAFWPNFLFFMWNPILGIWPISFAIADESFEAKLSAEVLVNSLHSNGNVMRKVYRDLTYRAALNEYRDSTWESVSEEVEAQTWRLFTRRLLRDLHGEFLNRTQAGDLSVLIGNIERQRQWESLRRTDDGAVHYSYVLGVGDFMSSDITPLEFVENDARAIRDHLKTRSRGKVVVHDYIGRTAGSAAKDEYDSGALSTLRALTQKVTERDTLFVYIAGKGAVMKTAEGTSSYLLLYDSVLAHDRIKQTSLPIERLRDFLAQSKAHRVVLLMDLRDIEYRELTQVGGGGGGEAGPPTDFYASIFPTDKEKKRGWVLLASASPGQRAYESADVGRGAFAYYLLEGVEGPADSDADGQVSVKEIYDYLGPRLGKFARLNGGVQEPVLLGDEATATAVFPQ